MTTIEKVLHDKFLPHVLNMTGASDLVTSVQFIKDMGDVNEISEDMFSSMYLFHVAVTGPVDVSQLVSLAQNLDEFCTEEGAIEEIGDHKFMLGDGDDGGAVQYVNGQFAIWLRGRKFK